MGRAVARLASARSAARVGRFALVDGPVEAQLLEPAYEVAAELALARADPDLAWTMVCTGLNLMHASGGEKWSYPLCWLGWRAEADVVSAGRPADPARAC